VLPFFGQSQTAYQPVVIKNAVLVEDSTLTPPVADPKQGFHDLFVSNGNTSFNSAQLNPQAVSFVQDYVEKFGKSMESLKTSGRPYLNMMDEILIRHGLPKELKYLAVIESQLKSNIRSWAGAVGPWQFMPVTARNYGLRVGKHYDERTDYSKSTNAACLYLTSLFSMYGDWLLVIAAYNGGPGNVNSAIRKSGSRDFWTLQNYLPAESRNHVKKFIATHYIMEGQGGVTTATKDEIKNQLLAGIDYGNRKNDVVDSTSKTQTVTGHYISVVIARRVGIELESFNNFNPGFDKLIAANGSYELRLPNEKMEIFLAKKNDILNESVQLLMNPDQAAR
jgi:membrane-bound lytic murein transglycosylase D